MIKEIYTEYTQMGIKVIPIQWDAATKQPVSHRNWSNPEDLKLRSTDNGLMILTGNGYGCLDFDLKNTKDKELFNKWMQIITNECPEVLNNLFIEQTRNGGYHVWMKYANLPKKTALAESPEGSEVIALYSNGPLVYTFPTPGYTEFSQSMADISEITEAEYNYLIGISQYFNEYKPNYNPNNVAVNYPVGYEKVLSEYDTNLSDEGFEVILNLIGLSQCNYKYRSKDKFVAYKRAGSTSEGISAKVYFKTKRVMIFSASLHNFPNWHNKESYPVWSLPPSFLLFYHFNREWEQVYQYLGISKPKEEGYPFSIFPQDITDSILEVAAEQSLNPVFLATAGIWTVASLAGNCYTSELDGVKNIIFAMMIAPVSVGKTPAFREMTEKPLKSLLESEDKAYKLEVEQWQKDKAQANIDKQPFNKPMPKRFHPFAVDGTTEGYIALMQDQEAGMGVYHDEAETILNAGAHKANNDAISFFTQAFSGGRYTQIRADRTKERVVKSLNISLLMSTQPSRLSQIFTVDRVSSGFASRFLLVKSDYIPLNTNADPFSKKRQMCDKWTELVTFLYRLNKEYSSGEFAQINIDFTPQAKDEFRNYVRKSLTTANERITEKAEDYILGAEAKMSGYFPRLCHLIAIINNPQVPVIDIDIVHKAWTLYRYYADSTIAILNEITAESDTGLPADLQLLYNALPVKFTTKEAEEVSIRLNIKPRRFIEAMRRKDFQQLFKRLAHGTYEKM